MTATDPLQPVGHRALEPTIQRLSLMRISIKRPPQTTRIFLGAILVVGGILLLRSVSEAIGMILILAGVAIGIRGSFGPIFTAIFLLAVFALILALMYSTVSNSYNFEEWIKYQWWAVLYAAFFVLYPVYYARKQGSNLWSDLKVDYGKSPETMGEKLEYPAVQGHLKYDEDLLSVFTMASNLGIFVVREGLGHIFFPWEKVKSVWVSGKAIRTVDIENTDTLQSE